MTSATVDDINRRLQDKHGLEAPTVHIVQFRPNIEIEGPVPYAEVLHALLRNGLHYCFHDVFVNFTTMILTLTSHMNAKVSDYDYDIRL